MHKYQFLKADIKPWLKYSFVKKYGIPTKYVDTTLNTNTTNTLTTVSGKIKNFKLHANLEQATSILPDGYTQVDYIESSGSQYIDTGVNADTKLRVILDMTYINPTGTNQTIGAINIGSPNKRYHLLSGANTISIWVNDTTYNIIQPADTNRHFWDLNVPDGKVVLDNTTTTTIPTNIDDTELNFWLFGRNSNASQYKGAFKIWACKMYYNGTLVRDFIPCYRNSDNEIGLYDLVNNVFYTNQGTGVFTYGSVVTVPNPDYPQEVKSVTGRQAIKITGTNIFKMEDFETTDYGIDIKCENNLLTLNGTQGSTPDGARYVSLLSNNKGNYQNYVGGDYITLPAGTYTAKFIHISGTMENYTPTLAFCSGNDNPKPYLLRIQPGNTGSFTLTEDTIVRACINFKNNINNYKCRITLTNNGSSTDELYVEKKYEVNLGNIELNKIGDYQDSIVKDNGSWYLHKEIGKVVLDGSDTGIQSISSYDQILSYTGEGISFQASFSNLLTAKSSTEHLVISNYFNKAILNDRITKTNIIYSYVDGVLRIATKIINKPDFKTWLSTHNTIVYYVLATPQYILLNDTLQSQLNAIENTMRSYKEQTNITVETNIDTTFDLSYKTLDS